MKQWCSSLLYRKSSLELPRNEKSERHGDRSAKSRVYGLRPNWTRSIVLSRINCRNLISRIRGSFLSREEACFRFIGSFPSSLQLLYFRSCQRNCFLSLFPFPSPSSFVFSLAPFIFYYTSCIWIP